MDVRLALRSFRRAPWSALTVAVTLGLGIGAATTTYAVFNHVVFRPVPGVAEPDRLVTLYYQVDPAEPNRASASYAHLAAMREGSPALDGLAAWAWREPAFGLDPSLAPGVITVTAVTRGYFELLGARARTGRLFSADDYDDASPVLVVSEHFVRDRLADDPAPVGREVYVNGRAFTIIGVVADYRGPDRFGRDDVWSTWRAPLRSGVERDASSVFTILGRLRPSATLAQAQAQARRASATAGEVVIRSTTFEPVLFAGLTDGIGVTRGRLLRLYWFLMAGVAMLLALACANAANLVVARNIRRRRDLAMRTALGAGRARLVRELAVESAVIAAVAASLAIAISFGLGRVFQGTRLLSYLPALDALTLDWRVVAFCVLVAATTPLLFGVAPAFAASRSRLTHGLHESARATPRTSGVRIGLVVTQLALSLTLLVGAGLLASTVWRLRTLPLGMRSDDVLTVRLEPTQLSYDDARIETTLREIRARFEAVPGFEAVALAWAGPFGSFQRLPVNVEDGAVEDAPREIAHLVSTDYFDVLGIPLLAGRVFTDADDERASAAVRPVLVNESFATRWFGRVNAVGESFRAASPPDTLTLEIVGVVGDVRHRELRAGFVPMVYLPAAGRLLVATALIRTSMPLAEATAVARAAVHEVDPLLPISGVSTIHDDIAAYLAEEHLLARLGSVIATLAALLAVAGLYAVMTFFVNEHVREFAIRIALGASGPDVARRVLRRVLGIMTVGFAVGIGLVLASSRLLASRLYGVDPLDPLTIGAAMAVLAGAALLAAWMPVRRATRVDPMESLRAE